MAKKSYRQTCSLAETLDLLGERWTLLIVRQLLFGPRRFTDLLEELPGISSRLLAERLALLNSEGVIVRRPAGAKGEPYCLTDRGQELESVILSLAKWGLPLLSDEARHRPEWNALALWASLGDDQDVTGEFIFVIDGEPLGVALESGRFSMPPSGVREPAAIVTVGVGGLGSAFRSKENCSVAGSRAGVAKLASAFPWLVRPELDSDAAPVKRVPVAATAPSLPPSRRAAARPTQVPPR